MLFFNSTDILCSGHYLSLMKCPHLPLRHLTVTAVIYLAVTYLAGNDNCTGHYCLIDY